MLKLKCSFAQSKEEALQRYNTYKKSDPFKNSIDPALLNSAHIQAYIAKAGMVFPYFPADDPKNEKVTSAALIMTIGPEVLYWDKENLRVYKNDLKVGDKITLYPNSITFLRPTEYFALPNYIAARFNLRIVHVHRGLLLGTGPLLDPGFQGWPMIPVHNLTENQYEIFVGDEFINVEFTKLSDISDTIEIKDSEFQYIENPGKTCEYPFLKYIEKNVPQGIVKSSISTVLDRLRNSIEEQGELIEKQNETIKRQEKQIVWTTRGAIIGIVATIGALIYGGYQLTMSSTDIINSAITKIDIVQEQINKNSELGKVIIDLQKSLEDIKSQKMDQPEHSTIKK